MDNGGLLRPEVGPAAANLLSLRPTSSCSFDEAVHSLSCSFTSSKAIAAEIPLQYPHLGTPTQAEVEQAKERVEAVLTDGRFISHADKLVDPATVQWVACCTLTEAALWVEHDLASSWRATASSPRSRELYLLSPFLTYKCTYNSCEYT